MAGTHGGGEGRFVGRKHRRWSLGPSVKGISLGLVARLALQDDIDAALRDVRPPHLPPDMPVCHVKGLRVHKMYREARNGDNGVQFKDAAKHEVFGCLREGRSRLL